MMFELIRYCGDCCNYFNFNQHVRVNEKNKTYFIVKSCTIGSIDFCTNHKAIDYELERNSFVK